MRHNTPRDNGFGHGNGCHLTHCTLIDVAEIYVLIYKTINAFPLKFPSDEVHINCSSASWVSVDQVIWYSIALMFFRRLGQITDLDCDTVGGIVHSMS